MKELPYKVVTKKLGPEAEKWCRDNIGDRWFAIGRRTGKWTAFWAGRDSPKNYIWHFADEKDAVWFGLKWQ